MENVVDRDIGAQETSHLLLKLPLSISSRTFVSLNVNQKNLQRVPIAPLREPTYPNKIEAYISRPTHLENTSLIDVTQKWTFKVSQKKKFNGESVPQMLLSVLAHAT
jgi:hypothetical protein